MLLRLEGILKDLVRGFRCCASLMVDLQPSVEGQGVYNSNIRSAMIQKLLPPPNEEKLASVDDQILLQTVIRYYQKRGHLEADLDPLGLSRKTKPHLYPPRSIIGSTKFPINLNTDYIVPNNTSLGLGQKMKLRDIIELLRKTYCGKMAVEFVYDYNILTRDWVKEQYEMMDHIQQVTAQDKVTALRKLIEIDIFQKFLDDKFPNTDRYRISGCESAIVALSALVEYAVNMSESKSDTIVIGCERVGRLEILAHVLNKPLRDVISLACPDNELGYFRYQMGTTSELTSGNKSYKICLVSQPSINSLYYPVAVGKAAGIQQANFQKDMRKIIPIMFHNCSEFESEGMIYETLKQTLSHWCSVDGVIHLIMNHQDMMYRKTDLLVNEIGYCTDVGKTIHSPIIHVNGHYMEGILNALQLAIKYRTMFKRDIIVDIVGYQRYPENFEPTCYQEVLWSQAIKKTPPLLKSYSEQLVKENIISEGELEKIKEEYTSYLEASSKSSDNLCTKWSERLRWNENILPDRMGRNEQESFSFDPETGINTTLLDELSQRLWKIPKNFQLSYKELELFNAKMEDLHEGKLDWVNCEAVAFASFISDGVAVRLTGVNVNKRRHVLVDPSSKPHNLLSEALSRSEEYCLYETNDSPCASAALEAGRSSASRDSLVLWEAPEADKTGTIQSLLDYLADSAHVYCNNVSLILLIPHFLQGKDVGELSPGRPERILSLAEEDAEAPVSLGSDQLTQANLVIVRPSTPASYFHAIRRHHLLPVARPLIIFVPSLAFSRSTPPKQISMAHEIISPTKFKWYLRDIEHRKDSDVEKLVLCTGAIYFNIVEERDKLGMSAEVAVSRIEQLFPFPYSQVSADAVRYPKANIYWVQEEPWSLGFSSFVIPRLEKATGKEVIFIGQPLTRDSYYTKLSLTDLYKILHSLFNN